MRISRILLIGVAIAQLATFSARAAFTYQLDNNSIRYPLNASDGTETLDNWFANRFVAQPGASTINEVDFGVFTTSPNSVASVVLYLITDPGGNPALGATRVYTQNFTPFVGDGTNAFLQQINLTTPVNFNPGDRFLVSIFIPNVIGAPPNDVYPYLIDTASSSTGSYWDRSAPGTFNLDNITGARTVDTALSPGGFVPGPGHMFIRAVGVPEPSVAVFGGFALAALAIMRRRSK